MVGLPVLSRRFFMTTVPSQRLKSETRAAHAAAEQTSFGRWLVAGMLSRREYAAQLVAYRELHAALETAFDANPRLRGRLGGPRSAWCGSDLDVLGEEVVPGPATSKAVEAWQSALIEPASIPWLLGCAYVMEGSALGSAFLAPRLEESLGLRPDELRYYRGNGRDTMCVWQEFRVFLDAELAELDACEHAIRAAKCGFGLVTELLEALAIDEGRLFGVGEQVVPRSRAHTRASLV